MRQAMFINRKYNNKKYGFDYIDIVKSLSNQEVHFEENKHRDCCTC